MAIEEGLAPGQSVAALEDLLHREHQALLRLDIEEISDIAQEKSEKLDALTPDDRLQLSRLRDLAIVNHDLIGHVLGCLRSALVCAASPEQAASYGPNGSTVSETVALHRRYG